jgi:hypothetical protein
MNWNESFYMNINEDMKKGNDIQSYKETLG